VAAEAVRLHLEQRRALAAARAFDGRADRVVDGVDFLPVDDRAGQAVRLQRVQPDPGVREGRGQGPGVATQLGQVGELERRAPAARSATCRVGARGRPSGYLAVVLPAAPTRSTGRSLKR